MQAFQTSVDGTDSFIQVTTDLVVHDPDAVGDGGVGAAGATIDDIQRRLEDAGELVSGACREIMSKVVSAAGEARPDELEVGFSLALSAEGGWGFIAKASGAATLEVTAKWKFSESE